MNPYISIIIPIYNAERYLCECIDSIIDQSYKNWEIIAINDGSTDKSAEILQNYSNRDSRIKVTTKHNEGVSIARNVGIEAATGDLIYFVDSDDVLYPDALLILVTPFIKEKSLTMVRADNKYIGKENVELFPNKKYFIRKPYNNKIQNNDSFYKNVISDEFYLWVCMFRKDIIANGNIRFIPHCKFMEDAMFILEYLQYSNFNIYLSKVIYGYRVMGESAGHAPDNLSKDFVLIKNKISSLESHTYVRRFDTFFERTICNKDKIYERIYRRIFNELKYLFYKWKRK